MNNCACENETMMWLVSQDSDNNNMGTSPSYETIVKWFGRTLAPVSWRNLQHDKPRPGPVSGRFRTGSSRFPAFRSGSERTPAQNPPPAARRPLATNKLHRQRTTWALQVSPASLATPLSRCRSEVPARPTGARAAKPGRVTTIKCELTGFSPRIDRIFPSSTSKRYSKG